jgi:YfiH family protein
LDSQINASYLPVNFLDNPANVKAYITLITGGVSSGDYSEYNLAAHVGDDLAAVSQNRAKLIDDLSLPSEPVWLDQVHSNKAVYVDDGLSLKLSENHRIQADASITGSRGVVCTVLTADCLPVFFCNQSGTEVAVAHAGWRGLHAGIISNTLSNMKSSADTILVSLGPAIGPDVFEVGDEVRQAFVDKDELNALAFIETSKAQYLCDIYRLARNELKTAGVKQVTGGDFCTYSEHKRFYSYRRNRVTGRMASLIWLD